MYEAFRVPFAAWMPGTIQRGQVSDKILWSLDLFPTFESLAGLNQVQLQLDGTDVWSELTGNRNMMQAKQSTKRPIFFYCNAHPMAVLFGDYAVHFETVNNEEPRQVAGF